MLLPTFAARLVQMLLLGSTWILLAHLPQGQPCQQLGLSQQLQHQQPHQLWQHLLL
jgi:hypothetical protein